MSDILKECKETLTKLFENKEAAQKITWAYRRYKDSVLEKYPEFKLISPLEAAYFICYNSEFPKCEKCGKTMRYKNGFVCTSCVNNDQPEEESADDKTEQVAEVVDTEQDISDSVEQVAEAITVDDSEDEPQELDVSSKNKTQKLNADSYNSSDYNGEIVEKILLSERESKFEHSISDLTKAEEDERRDTMTHVDQDADYGEYYLCDSLEKFTEIVEEIENPIVYFSKVRTDDGTPLYVLECDGVTYMFRSTYADLDLKKTFDVIRQKFNIRDRVICITGLTPVWILDSFNLHPFLNKLDLVETNPGSVRK